MGWLAMPEGVEYAALSLASGEAYYINGVTLSVDGATIASW